MTTLTSLDDGTSTAMKPMPMGEALRRLSGPLWTAMERLGTALIATDPRQPDNPIVFVNAAFTRLTGYAPADVLGRNCRMLQGPGTDRPSVAAIAAALQSGGTVEATLLNYRADGSTFWNSMAITPVLDHAGKLAFFLGTQTDITAQQPADLPATDAAARIHAVAGRMRTASPVSEVAAAWEWHIAERRIVGDAGFARDYGLDLEEAANGITPVRFFSIIHPQDRDRIRLAVGGMLRGAEVFSKEYRLVGNGVVRWVHARGRCHYDEADHPTHFTVVVVDISEQKRLQEQLRIAQTAGGVGTFEYVDGFGTATVSPQFCDLLGLYPAADLPVRTINALVLHGDAPIIDLAADPVPGATSRVECRILRPDTQEIRWLMCRGEYLLDAEISGTRFSGVIYDITEAKRTEEQLRSLTETLESRVEQRTRERDSIWRVSQDLLGVAGMNGHWQSINPAWANLLGWQDTDILGKTSTWLEDPDDRGATSNACARLRDGERIVTFMNRMRRQDGGTMWLSWTAVSEAGSLYCVGRDVTAEQAAAAALRQTEEQLRQAQKMEAVGQLTGGIAHDFNNMLQGVTSGIALAQRRIAGGKPEDAHRFLEAAREAAGRAGLLTQRLLAFGRRQALDPKTVVPNDLINSMQTLMQQTIGPAISVELNLLQTCWPVHCDPNQLENALLNLAINARDAMMPGGGRLTIDTAHEHLDEPETGGWEGATPGDYVRIGVTDTGSGMAPDVIAHAFEPFFTTKPIGQGTGLGLSQLYGFVRQSRGVVQLRSEMGAGTSVYLYLPRSMEAGSVSADTATAPGPNPVCGIGASATVLLVEDETVIRDFAAETLRELGYRVIEAADGPKGLTILQDVLGRPGGNVDLLVTDIGLPGGLNGRQLADAARVMVPSLPVLLITGYAGDAMDRHDAVIPGMEILAKPFALDTLGERVQAMLGHGNAG